MKKCELCNSIAKMYCDSDQASLCWDCDTRVHTANFLVAKHLRTLLCHICQSPTPWTASGPRLGPIVSVCQACANNRSTSNIDGDHDQENDTEDEGDQDDDNDDDDDDDDDSDEDSGDNQVVPLASSSSTPLPPPSSSSSSEEYSTKIFFKRNSNIGVFSKSSNKNARFSYDKKKRTQQKGGYKISSRTS